MHKHLKHTHTHNIVDSNTRTHKHRQAQTSQHPDTPHTHYLSDGDKPWMLLIAQMPGRKRRKREWWKRRESDCPTLSSPSHHLLCLRRGLQRLCVLVGCTGDEPSGGRYRTASSPRQRDMRIDSRRRQERGTRSAWHVTGCRFQFETEK